MRIANLIQHRLIHQSQHLVGGLFVAFHYAVQLRFQRVGRNGGHGLSPHQLGLQQLSVLLLLLGLVYYLLQRLVLSLGQVFFFSILNFLPECRIRLSEHEHRHDQSYSYQEKFLHIVYRFIGLTMQR